MAESANKLLVEARPKISQHLRHTAATATAPGSITIGGQTFPIAAGVTLTGAGAIAIGANLCLTAGVNASGKISNGTVSVTGTVAVNVVPQIKFCETKPFSPWSLVSAPRAVLKVPACGFDVPALLGLKIEREILVGAKVCFQYLRIIDP